MISNEKVICYKVIVFEKVYDFGLDHPRPFLLVVVLMVPLLYYMYIEDYLKAAVIVSRRFKMCLIELLKNASARKKANQRYETKSWSFHLLSRSTVLEASYTLLLAFYLLKWVEIEEIERGG